MKFILQILLCKIARYDIFILISNSVNNNNKHKRDEKMEYDKQDLLKMFTYRLEVAIEIQKTVVTEKRKGYWEGKVEAYEEIINLLNHKF